MLVNELLEQLSPVKPTKASIPVKFEMFLLLTFKLATVLILDVGT